MKLCDKIEVVALNGAMMKDRTSDGGVVATGIFCDKCNRGMNWWRPVYTDATGQLVKTIYKCRCHNRIELTYKEVKECLW